MFTIQYQAVEFMDSLGILIPILGIILGTLLPVLIILPLDVLMT